MDKNMIQMSHFIISFHESIDFLKEIVERNKTVSYNREKKEMEYNHPDSLFNLKIKLPLVYHIKHPKLTDIEQFSRISFTIPSLLILILRAGFATLGLSENGSLMKHKSIKKYMVRKKHGKAQLTYKALKGKSRGGSRLRLQQTQDFYEDIKKKLIEWKNLIEQADLILYQSSPRIWNNLFNKINELPIYKTDHRLRKIPIPTYRPNYHELRRVHFRIFNGSVTIRGLEKITSLHDVLSDYL